MSLRPSPELFASPSSARLTATPRIPPSGSCTNRTAPGCPPRLSSDIRFQPRADVVDDRNTAHGYGEDYSWTAENVYHLGESFSSEASRRKLPGLGAPGYRGEPLVPLDLEEAKRAWGLLPHAGAAARAAL